MNTDEADRYRGDKLASLDNLLRTQLGYVTFYAGLLKHADAAAALSRARQVLDDMEKLVEELK